MEFQDKIKQLRNTTYEKLYPYINSDYIQLDNPYHGNLGDVFIWEGECDFLKKFPFKCLESSNIRWKFHELAPETTIFLHGGGNFGDLYSGLQDFRLKVIEKYPDNPILLFPQSVWYADLNTAREHAKIMARHKKLTLCARDRFSYEFMTEHFKSNNVILVPDMAFSIDNSTLDKYRGLSIPNNNLLLKRLDNELAIGPKYDFENYDVKDWPTITQTPFAYLKLKALLRMSDSFPSMRKYTDNFAKNGFKTRMCEIGLKFLSPYDKIITTRLHVMIMSILLHKKVKYIDNTTHKIKAFADTWLDDLDYVKSL